MPKIKTLRSHDRIGGIGLKLDLRPLLAGERLLTIDYEFDLDTSDDKTSYLYGVRFPSPLKVTGDITNTAGYMSMRVSLNADYTAECARCLASVNGSFALDLEKTVAPRSVLSTVPEEKIDDYAIIDDGFLDIDDLLLQQIEVEFPTKILCKEDCKGLCQRCGINLNHEGCECGKGEIDPRLAPLARLLEEMKKEENNN